MGEYNQLSFIGGMNLLLDDTRLQSNQYRVGFNLRNRYDVLDTIPTSVVDIAAPVGIKQELVTFGNYVILFSSGKAWYRRTDAEAWTQIDGFRMDATVPRYWTKAIPVATTQYARFGIANATQAGVPDATLGVSLLNNIAAASAGNLPGLLVQDNINQPQFIFIDKNGIPTCRITQTYKQWSIQFDTDGTTVLKDQREYVPVGNVMEWDGVTLYIASQDGNFIYRSVSGRPLDFVVNVNLDGSKGGDATTTSYSVGVGGITCLRLMSSGAIFVAAGSANFSVSKNMTPNAPTLFGEYTFIRTFLFNASCLSDRAILDSLGDTKFIDFTGVRSFNAIEQLQNEGRNSPFTATIQSALSGIVQNPSFVSCILFDNYELYALQTNFGSVIAVYDTINTCWTSFDNSQTNGKRIKQFAKIELTVQALYAIAEDDNIYQLYAGTTNAIATVRTLGISSTVLYANVDIKMNHPKSEVKPLDFRVVVNNLTEDCTLTLTPFVNNRLTQTNVQPKTITYSDSVIPYTGNVVLPDIDTQMSNVIFSLPNCAQGWKAFYLLSWTSGSITQFSTTMEDLTPMNPLRSQINTK